MPKTIVVPLDGSELAERALPWARLLAQQLNNSLTLARIVPCPEPPITDFTGGASAELLDDVLKAELGAAEDYLARKKAELATEDLVVETIVREGPAADGLHDIVGETGASAIVMASHGRGGMVRFVLGSVADRLLHASAVPVMLVKAGAAARQPSLERILVALDGSALAERGLDHARGFINPGATLILARVVQPIYTVIGEEPEAMLANEEVSCTAEARTYLTRTAEMLSNYGVQAEPLLCKGRSANEILNTAHEADADVIVMTTHGWTGPARWVMGSIADEVFRHADQPVILVSARVTPARGVGGLTVRDLMARDLETMQYEAGALSAAARA